MSFREDVRMDEAAEEAKYVDENQIQEWARESDMNRPQSARDRAFAFLDAMPSSRWLEGNVLVGRVRKQFGWTLQWSLGVVREWMRANSKVRKQ